MKKVICIKENKGYTTLGNLYDVIEETENGITIYNDSGYPQSFNKDCFKNKKLNANDK